MAHTLHHDGGAFRHHARLSSSDFSRSEVGVLPAPPVPTFLAIRSWRTGRKSYSGLYVCIYSSILSFIQRPALDERRPTSVKKGQRKTGTILWIERGRSLLICTRKDPCDRLEKSEIDASGRSKSSSLELNKRPTRSIGPLCQRLACISLTKSARACFSSTAPA